MVNAHDKLSTDSPPRTLHFHFLEKPCRILVDHSSAQIASLETETQVNTVNEHGHQVQKPDGGKQMHPMQLLLKSIGYRGTAMGGVPFDDVQGIVPNQMGRVSDEDGSVIPGLYVTGWIKRGPQGIIGTNILDAEQTAQCVAEDLPVRTASRPREDIYTILKVR